MTRHFLDISSLCDRSIDRLLQRALALADGAPPARLSGSVGNLFLEPSTRTRVSFEMAARAVGLDVINIEQDRSSATKGESLIDTARTLVAMGIGVLVIRHPETGIAARLAAELPDKVAVINAGDGTGEHPSQALLDAATLLRSGLDFSTARMAMVGDLRHSRVARSGLALFDRLGTRELRIAGPKALLPEQVPARVRICRSLTEAVTDADVIMMLRIQKERIDRELWPESSDYHAEWGLRPEHLTLAAADCRVMHPGPINRGVEIADSVADGDQSLILDQVRMGVAARTALFEWVLG